eukprot:1156173-Pelagomonas_calceolata.AAC.3
MHASCRRIMHQSVNWANKRYCVGDHWWKILQEEFTSSWLKLVAHGPLPCISRALFLIKHAHFCKLTACVSNFSLHDVLTATM